MVAVNLDFDMTSQFSKGTFLTRRLSNTPALSCYVTYFFKLSSSHGNTEDLYNSLCDGEQRKNNNQKMSEIIPKLCSFLYEY